jgi:hypothetical protein
MRFLTVEEKCELISALANAKVNNAKKAKTMKNAAEDAVHAEDRADLSATADRFELWGQIDESLIELIRDGNIAVFEDGDEE